MYQRGVVYKSKTYSDLTRKDWEGRQNLNSKVKVELLFKQIVRDHLFKV